LRNMPAKRGWLICRRWGYCQMFIDPKKPYLHHGVHGETKALKEIIGFTNWVANHTLVTS
jgi:hypothetical protein